MTIAVPESYATKLQGLLAILRGWLILLSHYTNVVKMTPFSVVRDTKGGATWPAARPAGFASSDQKTQELQWCEGQHETGEQVRLSLLEPHWHTCNNTPATIPQSWTAWTHKQQIKWKIQCEMTTRKDDFFPPFCVRAQVHFKYNIQSCVSLALERCQ